VRQISDGRLAGCVEQLSRYLDLLNRDPLLAPVHGVFAAQEIRPQARVLATDRGIRCVTLDYGRGASSPRTRCSDLSGPVDVSAVINAYDVDDSFGLIDAVDHPVGTAACGVIAGQLAGERFTDPVRIVQ
jgi:hypothetical protein